jgi:HD-GYP domain-containing protein (c-di-GMP phosphodiesterase class II)
MGRRERGWEGRKAALVTGGVVLAAGLAALLIVLLASDGDSAGRDAALLLIPACLAGIFAALAWWRRAGAAAEALAAAEAAEAGRREAVAAGEDALARAERERAAEREQLERAHAAEVETLQRARAAERAELERAHAAEVEELERAHAERVQELERAHAAERAELERAWAAEREELLRRAAGEREELERAHAERMQELERAHAARVEELEGQIRQRTAAVERQRELLRGLQRSRQAEREWNRELRGQVQRLHRQGGDVSREDVLTLVLRATMGLVGARKGMLLARDDGDGDGRLDVGAAIAFEHEPAESALAQRFARRVLERDEIVREDEPTWEDGAGRTAADEEIDNLAAIPMYMRDRFSGVVLCANREGGFAEVEDDLLLAVGDHASSVLEGEHLRRQLEGARLAALRMLAEAIEARDLLLGQHSHEVAELVSALAEQLELEPREREAAEQGALLRDVGQLALPEHILLKPAPLTPEERSVVELHPRIGAEVLSQVPSLRPVATAVLHHHERYDGSGYPAGLKGDEIPMPARIVAVADAYSAMTHDRPHRPARTPGEASAELAAQAGVQFDPEVTQLLLEEVRRREQGMGAGKAGSEAASQTWLAGLGSGGLVTGVREDPSSLTDLLTLVAGHRAFHEAAADAAQDGAGAGRFAVALIQLVDLAEVNRREGYAAGDSLIRAAARSAQRTALRFGGSVYRESGRRIGVLVRGLDEAGAQKLARELYAEFLLGPAVRVAAAASRAGDRGDDVIERARVQLEEIAAGG